MRLRRFGRGLALGLVLVLGATGSLPGITGAWAQRTDYVPPELEGIEIQDRDQALRGLRRESIDGSDDRRRAIGALASRPTLGEQGAHSVGVELADPGVLVEVFLGTDR